MKKLLPLLIIITSFLFITNVTVAYLISLKPALNYSPVMKKWPDNLQGSLNVPILTYHHIRESKKSDNYSVSPKIFNKQMAWLKENNYRVIPYSEFLSSLTSNSDLPEKSVVISFDDGLKDQYLNGLPILKKYGYPAIFFVQTNVVGWWGHLNWQDLKNLWIDEMEIGSHSLSHKNLTKLSLKTIKFELLKSKLILENNLNTPINNFAYPNGADSAVVIEQVKKAGYWSAVTDNGGAEHLRENGTYNISRLHVENNLDSFINLFK